MTPDPAGPGDPLGQSLADWLENLGLADQLTEAGLPTYQRDDRGVARWVDPHTGDPLTAEQLTGLDALLHADGTDPSHAVPVALVQLARLARVREELLGSRWFDYAALAQLRGTSVDATRFVVHKASAAHLLLVVKRDHETLVPAFQLTDNGEPRIELAPLLTALLSAGMDPWRAWAWLTQPAALLGGLVPHEAAADPETAALAQHAAVRLAERVGARG